MGLTFSANLGFLWADLPLPDAIRAAARAGFDAVEFHWPYAHDAAVIRDVLDELNLPALGLNTQRGETNGLSARPGEERAARAAIDDAITYARAIRAGAVHVMAGQADGEGARRAFAANLAYACEQAPDLTILIEPLNSYDAPGYFLRTTGQALGLIDTVGAPNLKLMFDCYHVQIMEGDLLRRFWSLRAYVGHVQFAGVPDRGPPNAGEVAYDRVLPALGWEAPLGAEYKPGADTDTTLGWMSAYR